MGGVNTPSASDGGGGGITAVTAEPSATDGNKAGRCVRSHHGDDTEDSVNNVDTIVPYCTSRPARVSTEEPRGCGKKLLFEIRDCNVCALPVTVLDLVFTFLSVSDLRTVLGVCRAFYRAAVESDCTAWKAACLFMWRNKQGLTRVVQTWTATEEAWRRKELEIITLQQQMLTDANFGGSTTVTAATYECVPAEPNDTGVCHNHHDHPQQKKSSVTLALPEWTGGVCEGSPVSCAATSESDSAATGTRGTSQTSYGPTSMRSTATYEAIMNTKVSSDVQTSLIKPVQRGLPSLKLSGVLTEKSSAPKTKLYWWQMTHEQRQMQLRRLQQSSLHRQRYAEESLLSSADDEEETNSTLLFVSPNGGITTRHKTVSHPKFATGNPSSHQSQLNSYGSSSSNRNPHFSLSFSSNALLSRREVVSAASHDQEERDNDGVLEGNFDGGDADSEAGKEPCGNPYQEFEEEMVLTRALSLHQLAQHAADDEEDAALPVSWKFAYHMSLRDARRQKLTMQELIESTWYVCFRATGNTHPATFTANHTIVMHPPVRNPNSRSHSDAASDTAMPSFSYHLLKGGTELVVHNFPPLKVHRRSVPTSTNTTTIAASCDNHHNDNNTNNNNNNNNGGGGRVSANDAAVRAFLSEPDATLRRLMLTGAERQKTAEEESRRHAPVPTPAEDNRPDADWGWVMQNFFVKVFSADTPTPLYVQRLRRTCALRPP